MMSNIEWTQKTWNPVSGCTRVSPGCDHCYAVPQTFRNERMGQSKYRGLTVLNPSGDRHFNGVVRCDHAALDIPRKRIKSTCWFVNSMSDLFHKDVPDDFIDKVFGVMARNNRHTFQILTKRPERMATWVSRKFPVSQLSNVWLGVSVENEAVAENRIRFLHDTPAAVRFLSVEPILEAVDLPRFLEDGRIHWVIVGGESGPGARICSVLWIRAVVDACRDYGVPVFVKQLGSNVVQGHGVARRFRPRIRGRGGDFDTWPAELEDLKVRELPGGLTI